MRKLVSLISLLMVIEVALSLHLSTHQGLPSPGFCWRDSYLRGQGALPIICGEHQNVVEFQCVNKCLQGYSRQGYDCYESCPAEEGWKGEGPVCKRHGYNRTEVFPWECGLDMDKSGMIGRCEAVHGTGNCEFTGETVYPKCKEGFYGEGCCTCVPYPPNCTDYGYNNTADFNGCVRKMFPGNPHIFVCNPGNSLYLDLCYPDCKKGYSGVGPACWADIPATWVGCGMGAAKDEATCNSTVFNEIQTVGNQAYKVASNAEKKAVNTVTATTQNLTQLKPQLQALKEAIRLSQEAQRIISNPIAQMELLKAGADIYGSVTNQIAQASPTEILNQSAKLASQIDPKRTAKVESAFDYPKCETITL